MSDEPARRVVIGLGNPLRRDDGVGPAAVVLLESDPPPGTELVTLDGESTRLIEAWRDRDRAVVVDAVVTGAAPGTIHELEVGRDRLPDWDPGASTHAAGLSEAIALGRALERVPDELVIVGVEPGDVSFGPGLSAPVHAALDTVLDRVRNRLEQ